MIICVIAISLIIISILGVKYTHLKNQQVQVVEINKQRQEENKQIEEQNKALLDERNSIKRSVQEQNEILISITQANSLSQKHAEELAQKAYEAKCKELEIESNKRQDALAADYRLKEDELNRQIDFIVRQKKLEEQKLKDLEAKQMAYIEAEKRKMEMESNRDFYQLVLQPSDKSDITALRDLQLRFSKKDSIDKLIWEVYYKPAYDALMGRLFGQKSKVCGIYKITDITTGLAYIGQSVDIKERFRQHIKTSLAYGVSTNKLYQTLQKSGQYNFTFEILEEVDRAKLNERETYWINFYKTKEFGLNSTKGGS